METKKVPVEQHINQVLDGTHYRGHVKIAGTKLDYELVFGVPIAQLDSVEPAKDENEIRHLFQITIKRGGANIELTKEEYIFFYSMLGTLAVNFYNSLQTRNINEGLLSEILQGEGPMAAFGTSMSIGMISSESYDFPLGLCEMLSTPKFGCELTAT